MSGPDTRLHCKDPSFSSSSSCSLGADLQVAPTTLNTSKWRILSFCPFCCWARWHMVHRTIGWAWYWIVSSSYTLRAHHRWTNGLRIEWLVVMLTPTIATTFSFSSPTQPLVSTSVERSSLPITGPSLLLTVLPGILWPPPVGRTHCIDLISFLFLQSRWRQT